MQRGEGGSDEMREQKGRTEVQGGVENKRGNGGKEQGIWEETGGEGVIPASEGRRKYETGNVGDQ